MKNLVLGDVIQLPPDVTDPLRLLYLAVVWHPDAGFQGVCLVPLDEPGPGKGVPDVLLSSGRVARCAAHFWCPLSALAGASLAGSLNSEEQALVRRKLEEVQTKCFTWDSQEEYQRARTPGYNQRYQEVRAAVAAAKVWATRSL